jgi:hypothetical protein
MPDYRKRQDTRLLDKSKLLLQLASAEVYEDEDGNKLQTVYLGDIRSITPSGKVYYPFAHSNVDKCERCNGKGDVVNRTGKSRKEQALRRKEFQLIRIAMINGEYYHDWRPRIKAKINKIRNQINHWKKYTTCPECGGLGSLEARLDQDFWEQIEMELDEIGAWHHSSEGDGCDILISRVARGDATKEENQ